MQPFFSLNRKKISNTLLVIVHGIPVVPYGTEGRGAIIGVRRLQCAVFPTKNIEVMCTAPEVEQALDALIFVFDSCTFDDNRKSGARFHRPQQRRAARIKCQHTDERRYAVASPARTPSAAHITIRRSRAWAYRFDLARSAISSGELPRRAAS